MHVHTRRWRSLSKASRDEKLVALGITLPRLSEVRALEPRNRIVEATKLALAIDEEPNSDLIEYIAGYDYSGATFRFFPNMVKLMEAVPARKAIKPKLLETGSGEIDLVGVIPSDYQGRAVHIECVSREKVVVWQKVRGGFRQVTLARRISRLLFVAGISLYAGEGTKHSRNSPGVQLANANPSIHRVFLKFLEALGAPRSQFKGRIQVHGVEDIDEAHRFWDNEIHLPLENYYKPLLAVGKRPARRKSYTLTIQYNNMMLCALLTHWSSFLEDVVATLDT